jgi:hypothetical protein
MMGKHLEPVCGGSGGACAWMVVVLVVLVAVHLDGTV